MEWVKLITSALSIFGNWFEKQPSDEAKTYEDKGRLEAENEYLRDEIEAHNEATDAYHRMDVDPEYAKRVRNRFTRK